MKLRALLEELSLPNRRELLELLGAGVLVAFVCWYFGVNVWHSVALGCAIAVIGLAIIVGSEAPAARELNWRVGKRANREGSRSEVSTLATSLRGGWGFVGLTAERKLMQLALRRLALEGLDLNNPQHRDAIERRIGTRAYRTLARPSDRMPSLRRLLHCLDMLDALDSTHYPAPQRPARREDRFAIPFSLGRARDR